MIRSKSGARLAAFANSIVLLPAISGRETVSAPRR
jgi:hypothetical protein